MHPCILLCNHISKTSLFLSPLFFYRLLRLLDPLTDTHLMPPGHLRVGHSGCWRWATGPHCVEEQFASSRGVTLLMSVQRTHRAHLPDRLWDSGKALDRCGCPSSSAAVQGQHHHCVISACLSHQWPYYSSSHVWPFHMFHVWTSSARGMGLAFIPSFPPPLGSTSYQILWIYILMVLGPISFVFKDTFSLISTTRRHFGWSPWTHSCILSPYHCYSDWKEIWLCSPQLLQFLGCQKRLRKSYCLITS